MTGRMVRWAAERRRAAAALLALALGCGLMPPPADQQGPTTSAPKQAMPPAGYRLVWSDEFDATALDPSRWNVMTGPRRDGVMSADSVSVQNGVLHLTTWTDASGAHHTGFITTQDLYQGTYGYFEARIRFHDSPGEWCAFWLASPTNGDPIGDPATAGVEIDVVEHRVTDQGGWTALRDMVAINLNWDGYGPERQNVQKVVGLPDGSPLQGAWRNYGVLWTDSGYAFFVDGVQLFASSTAISKRSEYVVLSCEVSDGTWAGFVPQGGYGPRAASATGMDVDYVHVWQKP